MSKGEVTGFNHVGISVTDLDRSIAFYRDHFGLEPLGAPFPFSGPQFSQVMGLAEAQGRMCMIARGNLWLELFEFSNPKGKARDSNYPVSDCGISHFGFTVDDIDAVHSRLHAAGVPIHAPVQTFQPSGMRATYCRDPDGNVFEIMQPGQLAD